MQRCMFFSGLLGEEEYPLNRSEVMPGCMLESESSQRAPCCDVQTASCITLSHLRYFYNALRYEKQTCPQNRAKKKNASARVSAEEETGLDKPQLPVPRICFPMCWHIIRLFTAMGGTHS